MSEKPLAGKKVAVLVETEYIADEVAYYRKRVPELGGEVHLLSYLWGNPSKDFVNDIDNPDRPVTSVHRLTVDRCVTKADPDDYDIVICCANYVAVRLREIPPMGNLGSPELTRTAPAVQFFAKAMRNPRVVKGAMCHALWLLTPHPELLRGRRVICHTVVLSDVHNAGATYVPDPSHVVVDDDLVTARSAADLEAYFQALVHTAVRKGARQTGGRPGEVRKKVHIVLSSFGFWGEELVAPLQEFDAAGIAYDFSTPYGHPPAVVDVSLDPAYVDPRLNRKITSPAMAAAVKGVLSSGVLANVRAVQDVRVEDFDALLLVGGSGPVLDTNNCRFLHNLILDCVLENKLVAAECYAVGALAFTRYRREVRPLRSVVWKKVVTGHPITHDYITEYGYSNVTPKYPFIGPAIPLEYLMTDAVGPDGQFFGNSGREISVIVDYPFLTSRSVAESRECGRQVVKCLTGRYPGPEPEQAQTFTPAPISHITNGAAM